MARIKFFKETALPGTLQAHSVYLVNPTAKPDFVEIYVTNASAVAKRIIDETRVQAMIDASGGGGGTELEVVANIAARDALTPTANVQAFVIDASADGTVTSGSATYIYDFANTTWYKTSEFESLDVVLSWENLTDKPSSSVADIDDAVAKKHSHANKTQLDKIDEDGDGNFTYNSALPRTGWETTAW